MSIALDGFKVLKRLGDAPGTFASVRADVDKSARALVVKCLKAKSTGLDIARAIHDALHDKPFELLVDGLKPAELKSLLAKLDKHHPDIKTMSVQAQQRHLLALTRGEIDAAQPVAKASKAKKSGKQQKPQRLHSGVADLIRARGERDED